MRRLIKHIEQLLYREECVVVPGLGAFILHQLPAVADEPKGLIYPGRSRISFNSALNQNDGVLVQSYSTAFSFGYKRSLALVESDVQELRSQLLANGVAQMGEIGKLMQSRGEEQIRFIPNESHPFSVDHYGLQPVAMLPKVSTLGKSEEIKRGKRGDIYYLPINLKHLAYGSAAAAMVAVALLIPNQRVSIPSDVTQYQAGFVSSEVAPLLTPEPTPTIEEVAVVAEDDAQPSAPQLSALSTDEAKGRYFAVVATLSSEQRMEQYLIDNPDVRESVMKTGGVIVSNGGRHRVYMRSFDTAKAAQQYLRELTSMTQFADSWVYKP